VIIVIICGEVKTLTKWLYATLVGQK